VLNNRELASVIWLGVILLAASLSSSVRSSLWQVVKLASIGSYSSFGVALPACLRPPCTGCGALT
jgi:hypothetical protein